MAKPDDEERQHGADAVEGGAADAADLPGLHAGGDVAAGQGDGGDERGERRRRRRPGQRELERRRRRRGPGSRRRRRTRPRGPRRRSPSRRCWSPRTARTRRCPATTASEAPMLIPRTPGSASGLRVTPCMTAPESPSAAPTSTARTVRGIRLVTAASPMVSDEPPRAATMSDQPTSREPTATEATMSSDEDRDDDEQPEHADPPRAPHDGGARGGYGVASPSWSLAALSAASASMHDVVLEHPGDRQRRGVRGGAQRGVGQQRRSRRSRRRGSARAAGRRSSASTSAWSP